jgi:hypothetical protein
LGKAIPVTGCGGPWGCETLRPPHFLHSRLTDGGEVLATFHPPGRFLVLISVSGGVNGGAIMRLEGLGKSKKFSNIGNQTHDLPPCIIVPQEFLQL